MTKITHRIISAIFIVCAFITVSAQSKKLEKIVTAKAKTTLVSRIEKGMPNQLFAVWFQELVGRKTPVSWSVNDCGEQTGTSADRGRDFPLCVEANAKKSTDFHISVNVQYGTFRRGIARGIPVVRSIFCGDESEQNGMSPNTLKELRQRAKQIILDAQFFDPNIGIFQISNDIKSPGFENFDSMWIETHEMNSKGEYIPLKPHGEIIFGQLRFALQNIFFDGRRWTFETVRIEKINYRFAGKFSKIRLDNNGVQNSEKVLQGHLIKFIDGKQTAEADLIFSFYVQGE